MRELKKKVEKTVLRVVSQPVWRIRSWEVLGNIRGRVSTQGKKGGVKEKTERGRENVTNVGVARMINCCSAFNTTVCCNTVMCVAEMMRTVLTEFSYTYFLVYCWWLNQQPFQLQQLLLQTRFLFGSCTQKRSLS